MGLAALVVSIAAACTDSKEGINGECNAQGDNNQVVCNAVLPRTYGDVKLSLYNIFRAFYIGHPQDLPRPLDYPEDEAQSHCDDWSGWFAATPDIYTVGASFKLEIQAGSSDLVVIKDVRSKIFNRKAASAGTLIKCSYGGGSNAGVSVVVDTVKQRTTFSEFDSDETRVMPPGSITLGQGDAGFLNAQITLDSKHGHLYEGQIIVDAIVNGVEETYVWGTKDSPFRWVEDETGEFVGADDDEAYDWHPQQKKWVKGFDPFSMP
ncbi:hypothetical protein ACGFIG_02265 [Micromonospora sp. NPDC049048]|uniref:hypothetical protein n=1 Tax=Micromonospora sp. NPDC049048 TaxID=3364263 RepID=UPI003723D097